MHFAILLTFIKLPVVLKTFVLSIFEWPFYTGLIVHVLRISLRAIGATSEAEREKNCSHWKY